MQHSSTPPAAAPPTAAPRTPRTTRGVLGLLFTCLLLLGLTACGEGRAVEPKAAKPTVAEEMARTRGILVDAREVAASYGMKHLGHYLKFDERFLAKADVVEEGIRLHVKTTHTSFCISATNAALPDDNPWHTASIGSTTQTPLARDKCK